jgi:Zn-dependent protease with chaperone function
MKNKSLASILFGFSLLSQPTFADDPSFFSGLFKSSDSTDATTKSKNSTKSSDTEDTLIHASDPYCDMPQASYSVMGSVINIGKLAVGLGGTEVLQKLQNGGTNTVDGAKLAAESTKILQQYSKENLWLPIWAENAYGSYQHQMRVKDGIVIAREDASPKTKLLYEKADRIFSKIMSYAPEKMPYVMHLYITTEKGVSAEAIPGGYIYISQGALQQKDDAVPIFILAHEISHVSKRHLSKQFQARLVDSGAALQLFDTLVSTNQNANALTMLMTGVGFVKAMQDKFATYSQDQEFQADACAANLSYDVNADPILGFKKYVKTQVYVKTARANPKFLGLAFAGVDHPSDAERQSKLNLVVEHWKQVRDKPDYVPPQPHKFAMLEDAKESDKPESTDSNKPSGFMDKVGGFFHSIAPKKTEDNQPENQTNAFDSPN